MTAQEIEKFLAALNDELSRIDDLVGSSDGFRRCLICSNKARRYRFHFRFTSAKRIHPRKLNSVSVWERFLPFLAMGIIYFIVISERKYA
jgi:hypothetical protein